MTPVYYTNKRKYTKYIDKFHALIKQGYSYDVASRMATNLEVIYG